MASRIVRKIPGSPAVYMGRCDEHGVYSSFKRNGMCPKCKHVGKKGEPKC